VVSRLNPFAMYGIDQRTSRKSGSSQNLLISWDVFAHSSRNRHVSTRVTPTTRASAHPPQRTPIPHALLRRVSHSVSRSTPNQSANGDAGTLAPRHPISASLTLLRPS
jgi:hypothetical protein